MISTEAPSWLTGQTQAGYSFSVMKLSDFGSASAEYATHFSLLESSRLTCISTAELCPNHRLNPRRLRSTISTWKVWARMPTGLLGTYLWLMPRIPSLTSDPLQPSWSCSYKSYGSRHTRHYLLISAVRCTVRIFYTRGCREYDPGEQQLQRRIVELGSFTCFVRSARSFGSERLCTASLHAS